MSENPIRVRPARPEDLPALGRMGAELVRYHHELDPQRFLMTDSLEQGYTSFLGSQLGRERSVVLVAERAEHGAVVGYAYGTLEGREWVTLLDDHGMLHDVYVVPAARGLGAGRSLVVAAIAALERLGAPRVVLSTASGNAAAQRLFESLGFRRTMIEMTREADRG